MVLLGIHLAALVELAAVDADVVILGCHGNHNQLYWFGLYEVDVAECLEIDERNGSRRRESADGQAALDDTAQAAREGIALAELQGGAAQVVCPVILLVARHVADVELSPLVELEGTKLHNAIELWAVGDVDAFVDGKAGYLAQVGIAVCTDGTDTIGAESQRFRLTLVNLMEFLLAFHGVLSILRVLSIRRDYFTVMFCMAPIFSQKRRRYSKPRRDVRTMMVFFSPGNREKKLSL